MSATVQADAFLVCEVDDATAATAPLDITVISESVSIVLELRDSEPPAALRQLWFSWLAGHLHLLMPIIEARPGQKSTRRCGRPPRLGPAYGEHRYSAAPGQRLPWRWAGLLRRRPVTRTPSDEVSGRHGSFGHLSPYPVRPRARDKGESSPKTGGIRRCAQLFSV